MKQHVERVRAGSRLTEEQRRNGVIEERPGFIYYLLSADGLRVKIGYSSDLANRLNTLKRQYPGVRYLGHTIGSRAYEFSIHERFDSARRSKHEWFELTEELRWFITNEGLTCLRPRFYDEFPEIARQPACEFFTTNSDSDLPPPLVDVS